MLIQLKSSSLVLIVIGSISMPICNRFHTIRANNGKITSFRGYLSLTLSSRGTFAPRGTKCYHEKLEILRQPRVKIS